MCLTCLYIHCILKSFSLCTNLENTNEYTKRAAKSRVLKPVIKKKKVERNIRRNIHPPPGLADWDFLSVFHACLLLFLASICPF